MDLIILYLLLQVFNTIYLFVVYYSTKTIHWMRSSVTRQSIALRCH